MPTTPDPHPSHYAHNPLHRLARWARQRRRAALGLLLRGACYGLGTGMVSLATYWVQNRL